MSKKNAIILKVGIILFLLIVVGRWFGKHWSNPEHNRALILREKSIYANMEFSAVYNKSYAAPSGHDEIYAVCQLDSFKYLGNDVEPMWLFSPRVFRGYSYIPFCDVIYSPTTIAIVLGEERISNLKKHAHIYTSFGDSTIHYEMKNGRYVEY